MIFLPAVHNFPFWWSSSELPTSKPPPPPPLLLHVLWFLKNIFMEINIEMNFSSCIWARGRGSRNARCASLEERAVIHKIETCLRERTEARQKLVASRCFVYFLYICWSCKISSFCSCCWFWAFPLNLFFLGGGTSSQWRTTPTTWYVIFDQFNKMSLWGLVYQLECHIKQKGSQGEGRGERSGFGKAIKSDTGGENVDFFSSEL